MTPVVTDAGFDVVILAGGLGTRIRPVVGDRPKAMADVGGYPFLERLLAQVAEHGAQSAVLCVGHLAGQVEAHFGDGFDTPAGRVAIRYAREQELLGTGGALRNALPLLSREQVLVLNGDSYCDADLGAFLQQHASAGAALSLLLTRLEDCSRFGRVSIDGDGKVLAFEEKGAGTGPGWINAGLYATDRATIRAIPPGRAVSLEREIFPSLLGRGLRGWTGGGRFIDIGTPESYASAGDFFAAPSTRD